MFDVDRLPQADAPVSTESADPLTDPLQAVPSAAETLVDPLCAAQPGMPHQAVNSLVDTVAESEWNPGSMGDGKGKRGKAAGVLQTQKKKRSGKFIKGGGRAQRNWKFGRDASYGVQQQGSDGQSSGKSYTYNADARGKGRDVKKTDSKTGVDGTTRTNRSTLKEGREKTQRTRQYEERERDGGSYVKREVNQEDFDGKKSKTSEVSRSFNKKRGIYSGDGDFEKGASGYEVEHTKKSKGDKVKGALKGKKEDAEALKRKLTRKKKRHELKKQGPSEAGDGDAYSEGDAGKAQGKHGAVDSMLRHLAIGSIGDESGLDLDSFQKNRANEVTDTKTGISSENTNTEKKTTATAGFGKKSSCSAQHSAKGTDAFGNETVGKAGINGTADARLDAKASQRETWTSGGVERGVNASVAAGVAAEVDAGATHQTNLGGRVKGEAGASVGGKTFVGIEGNAGASTTVSGSSVKAKANAEASIGGKISGHVGGKAGINRDGFALAAVRAKADGQAFAGAKAGVTGEAEASWKGARVTGAAKAMAGAEASGMVTAGGSLGGVDVDAVAEGEAFVGAQAHASGNAEAGLTGFGLGGQVGAFAGAKAGGQVRAELGAGGLNFGLIGVEGNVRAGAGAEASGELYAKIHKTGAQAEAGAALGVGAGVGMVLTIDPSFPLRLPLEKLAESGVIPSADPGDLTAAAFTGMYRPEGKGAPTTIDDAKASQNSAGRDAIDAAKSTVSSAATGGAGKAFGEVKKAMTFGSGLLNSLKSALTGAFASVGQASEATGSALGDLVRSGIAEAGSLISTLGGAVSSAVGKIGQVKSLDPKALIDGDWEARIDDAVVQVTEVISAILDGVRRIVTRIKLAGHVLIDRSVEAGAAPLSGLGGLLGHSVGSFGGMVAGAGRRMIGHVRRGLVVGETGVKVKDIGGKVVLPVAISPVLKETEGVLGHVETAGKDTVSNAVDGVTEDVKGGIKTALRNHHDNEGIGALAKLTDGIPAMTQVSKGLLSGVASAAKFFLRPIASAARMAAEAAKAVAKAVSSGAKVVANIAKKAWGWFTGLFG